MSGASAEQLAALRHQLATVEVRVAIVLADIDRLLAMVSAALSPVEYLSTERRAELAMLLERARQVLRAYQGEADP